MKLIKKWAGVLTLAMMLVTVPLASQAGIKDWFVGLGAVVGAGVSAAVGLPPLGVAAGAAAGAAVPAVVIPDTEQTLNDVIDDVPEEDRAGVLKAHAIWMAVESLGKWIIAVVAGFFFVPMLLGYFIPRRKEVKHKKEMVKLKEMLFDDPNYKMEDIQ